MKKLALSFLGMTCLFLSSVEAYNVLGQQGKYQQEQPNPYKPVEVYRPRGPDAPIHMHPNGHGYSWIEPGDTTSNDPLERIPRSRSIDPDGCGGFIIR